MMAFAGKKTKKILILIEDGSFLYDNRVKREAETLTAAGYQVAVICPRYPGESSFGIHGNVHIYRYTKWEFGGHFGEYLSSLIKGGWLTLKAWRRHGRFDFIQACNPPDLWFTIAALFKLIAGTKFVFDHHDICPELFLSRFGENRRIGYAMMLLLEKLTFKLSDGVISTNESYKRIARERGGIPAEKVRVVRNGPDLKKFSPRARDPQIQGSDGILVGYLGNMNPQDGVDHLLLAAQAIVHQHRRTDIHFVLIGKGDAFDDLNRKAKLFNLNGKVRFMGRLPDEEMLRYLSSCDICVQPDPLNPLNNLSTMNKVMEYMALEKPVVAYDLVETRYTGGDCLLYAEPNNPVDLARKIIALADDPEKRKTLGKRGRKRIEASMSWEHSEIQLLDLYRLLS
jgi:glycosyltransferase involved in cell wall biosynthesis